ncbi:Catalase precursor [compost metagenome]
MSRRGNKSDVNYQPSKIADKPEMASNQHAAARYGDVTITQARISKPNNFKQAGEFDRSLDEVNRTHLIKNLLADLGQVKDKTTQGVMVGYFYMADRNLGMQLAQSLNLSREAVEKAVKSVSVN